jgi:hypothetical protein
MRIRTIHINCNTRPVRLAFLIDTPDPLTLEKVFKVNTLLWGGFLNPVVVLDGSTRKQLGAHYAYEDSTYEQEQLMLLRAFDPDLLINYSNVELPPFLAPFRDRTFTQDVMRWNPWGTQEMMAFLEVWPFLQHYWRKEFRFIHEPQEKYGYIDFDVSGDLRTFLVARFGSYPEENQGEAVLVKNFGAKLVSYQEDFRKSFSLGEWIFPIQITTLQLEIPAPSTFDSYILFLLDAENMFDIVDYWNLRAAGYRVFPLPTSHYQDFSQSAKLFAERSVYPINQNVTTTAEVVKARSVDDSQWEDAGQWFVSLGVNAERLSLKGWVPHFRMSRSDRRVHTEMQIRPPVSTEADELVVFDDGHGSLRVSAPDCELTGPYFSQHWVTELQALGTTDEDSTFRLPWLHPECDALVNRKVGRGHRPYSSRVSQHGIVVLQRGDRENLWIQEPKVTEVLRAYLKDGGFTYLKTSTPGLTLQRIIDQLGGLLSCTLLQQSGVRELIEKLAHGSHTPANDVRRIIYKSLRSDKGERHKVCESILSRLVEAKVLRQGFELQCERCQLRDWYHLSDLGADFKCKKCFHAQQVPNLDGMSLCYASDGLFRLEGKVAGCLTTILSLLFIKCFVGHDVKYAPSFDYMDGSTHGERDFALFLSDFFQDNVDVVIGECKSLNEIEQTQRNAIKQLGDKTGAYLAFCTLSEAFTPDDQEFFEELVAAGQKPILLTRKHLEMQYLEIGNYHHESHHWIGRDIELISRLTIREVLGNEFADKHRLRI